MRSFTGLLLCRTWIDPCHHRTWAWMILNIFNIWFVVDLPLWKIWNSMARMRSHIWNGKIKNVPNHQSYIYILYYIIWIWSYMAMNQHLQIGFWGEWTSAMSGRTKMYQGFDPKLYVCCSSLKENTLSWVWNTAFLSLYSWRAQQKHQHSQKIIQLAIITTASPQTHLPGLEINMIKKLTLGGNQEHWTIFED